MRGTGFKLHLHLFLSHRPKRKCLGLFVGYLTVSASRYKTVRVPINYDNRVRTRRPLLMSTFHVHFRVDNPSKAGNCTMKSIGSGRQRKQNRIMEEEKKVKRKEEEENIAVFWDVTASSLADS